MKHKNDSYSWYIHDQRMKIIDSIKVEYVENAREILTKAKEYIESKSERPYIDKEHNLKAIMVNNIRHQYTNYDSALEELNNICIASNSREKRLSYYMLKNAVLNKIAETYPYLADECKLQKHTINMIR